MINSAAERKSRDVYCPPSAWGHYHGRLSNRRVYLSCPAENFPALPIHRKLLQCPTAKYLCRAQPQYPSNALLQRIQPSAESPCNVVSLQSPTSKYPRSAQSWHCPDQRMVRSCSTPDLPCRAHQVLLLALPNCRTIPPVPCAQPKAAQRCPTVPHSFHAVSQAVQRASTVHSSSAVELDAAAERHFVAGHSHMPSS